MCGIAGIWRPDGPAVTRAEVEAVTRPLAHRGPDGEGVELLDDGRLGLGHRRLAILDPTPQGRQPMSYGDGRWWITFNGEVFDFAELGRELEGRGHRFRTRTDTEVILAAYAQWGPECQLRFNGMWAFAIWDAHRRELFLSRDRFGIKPLYLLRTGGRLAFASELKSFRFLSDHRLEVDPEGMRRTLLSPSHDEALGLTPLRDVVALPGGHQAIATPDGLEQRRWWETADHLHDDVPTDPDQQAERFLELFLDACRLRLRSDVPVATSLSGGLDSSSVLAGLRRGAETGPADARRADWHRAFVASFPGSAIDETRYALSAARATGAEAVLCELDPAATLDRIEQLVYDTEVIIPTFIGPVTGIYEAMRGHGVKVSLDGHGGDELLAGYEGYVTTAMLANWGPQRDLRRQRDLVDTLAHMRSDADPSALARLRIAVAGHPLGRRVALGLRDRWQRRMHEHRVDPRAWLRDPPVLPELPAPPEHLHPVDQELYRSFHHTSLPAILRNFDRASMVNSVEVRMPLMDWRVVTYGFSLPWTAKIADGHSKAVLRRAMRGMLPEDVRLRRWKVGFGSPLTEWFAGPLQGWLQEVVEDPAFLDSEVWNGPAVRDAVAARRRSGAWTRPEADVVWLFANAHLWTTRFTAPTGSPAR